MAAAAITILTFGCGAARVFLDLPPPAPTRDGGARARALRDAEGSSEPAHEDAVPWLETTLDPESLLARLPLDVTGYVDWVAAVDSGWMRPRPEIGSPPRSRGDVPRFGFDFHFAGADTMFDAWFPHSVHAEVIDCRQCHGRVFKYRNERITMSSISAGEHCGACHGKVAFPVETGCKRCHDKSPFPAAGGVPQLIGDVVMARAHGARGIASGVDVDSLPHAVFPHWVHRIRYECRTCHTRLFEAKSGAQLVTMADIQQGKACGACHDGTTAFRAGFGNCQRCHAQR